MIQKKKKEKELTKLDMTFEEALKMSGNTPLFKSMELSEMLKIGRGKIWEIKLIGKSEMVFAQLLGLGGISKPNLQSKVIAYFNIIHNIQQVDEDGAEPFIKPASYQQTDLEGVRLTDIKI